MIPKTDRIGNFVKIVNTVNNTKWRLHQSDVPKLGSNEKVAVYELGADEYEAPSKDFPKGRYFAKFKFFIGTYLRLCTDAELVSSQEESLRRSTQPAA